jgi:hypothetical protein
MGMDVYGKKPSSKAGEYFRANVWSWRPIHTLCELVHGGDLPGWGYNDGAGFSTQAECNTLAEKLEHYLDANPREKIAIESEMRVTPKGRLFKGDGGESAYSTSHEHVREFIKFLRACGGFKIC